MTAVAAPIGREGHIVITGGAGFLGTNIADALAARGNKVLIVDNLSRPHVGKNLAWLTARHSEHVHAKIEDIRNAALLEDAIRGAQAVIHLAAQVAVTTSIDYPVTDFDINARGTLNVLESIRKTAPHAPLLFASTNKVYGKMLPMESLRREELRYVPNDAAIAKGFDESTPLSFHTPYGCSKGTADQYVLDYARIYGLKAAVFRMSCLYGPHQYGNEDQGWVAHLMISALHHRPVTIYGNGCQVRDVLYVDDAVRAYLLALENIGSIAGRAFNLGGGPENSLSLRELLHHLEPLGQPARKVSYEDWRPGDQYWYVSDTTAFAGACGWYPRISVEDGLVQLRAWLERQSFTPSDEANACEAAE
jgi:CDP-paratose 2-epimerase